MGFTLFDTQVKIGIDDADFKKGIELAGTMVKDFAVQGTQALASFTKSLVSGVSELASFGDHIDKQSQKMNLSAKAYQEWDAIMQHSGTTIDSMQASMKTLANAAESDSEAFEMLGMSLEDVKQMSSEELFSKTITALQNVESDTQRTYIAGQLLGRGATELGALLNTSAEDTEKMRQRVHELGGVMSDEAVKASAKFQDSLQDMKTAMSGLTRGIKSDFLPSFTKIMDGVTSIFAGEEGGEKLLERGISDAMTTLSNSANKIKPVIEKLGTIAFNALEQNLPSIIKRTTRLVGRIATGVVENIPNILSSAGGVLETIGETVLEFLPDWLGNDIKSIFGSIKDFVSDIDFHTLIDRFGNLGESLTEFGEKVSSGIALAFENVLKPFGTWVMNDALPAAMSVIGGILDNINIALDILAPIGEAAWNNFFKPLFSGIGDLSIGTLDLFAKALQGIADTFKGFDSIGFIKDIIDGNFGEDWMIGIKDIGETIEGLGKDIDEFFGVNGPAQLWNRLWQDVGGAIFDAKEIITGAITDIVNGIKELVSTITSLPGKWVDFWSGFGEYLASDWAERHMVGSGSIDSNADGGYVSTPRLSWVAEKEPEYIIPESKMDSFLSQNSGVTININVEGGISSDYDVERIANKLADLNIFQTRAIGGTGF